MSKNIVLTGMPGCGKSTVGVVLAKTMGYRFVDSDLVIQEEEGRLLKDIIAEDGPERFMEIENRVNYNLKAERSVIATGGSVVYGKEAMEKFHANDIVVYIRLSLESIQNRLGDIHQRGVVVQEGQSLEELYAERCPLYEKYAHVIVDAEGLEIVGVMEKIKASL